MTGSVLAIDVVDRAGRLHQLVLKQYTPEPSEPDSPKREAHILELLRTSDLSVPRVVAVDPDGVECEMPALLMTRLPGRPRIWPRRIGAWISDLVVSAAHIHATPISHASLPAYARYEHDKPAAPSWSKQPEVWEEAIAAIEKPPPTDSKTFIHRDFHAGNMLWNAGKRSGVVDWLHGCWGPPEQDLAHCRLNIWCNQGPAAADALVKAYQRLVPDAPPYHPYWDLDEALGNTGAENAFGNPRRYESFIAAAVSKL
jgi:aminoglycoside phosphotransferase (APT) family kinase protein